MEAHTAKERKLKSDIIQKNIVRRNLQNRLSAIHRWSEQLTNLHNHQKHKRIEASIKRYQEQIDHLQKELFRMGEGLEKEIKEEMTYS